jgi:hypothetical protein
MKSIVAIAQGPEGMGSGCNNPAGKVLSGLTYWQI